MNAWSRRRNKLSTLTHELGHALLHDDIAGISTSQKEFEADAFSIMLSANYGVELTDTRKKHLADNVRMFKTEVLAGLGEDCTDVQRKWQESLYKSFSSVYSMYRENIEQIEKYVDQHVSKEELLSVAEKEKIDERFQLNMKKEQLSELALFCMDNEGVPEIDRLYETISENLGVSEVQKEMVM